MHIHFIQHMLLEHPGTILDWATKHQHNTSYTKIFESQAFPFPDTFDMLVIMGGEMGVYEEEKYEWIKAEKLFIKNSIRKKKKVLGICLGAQFIAEALDAKVFPHTRKEIGWFPVQKITQHPLTENFPQNFTTFHWHGDTFNLPGNAIHLFKSEACLQQGFVYNSHVAGLQFHIEVTGDLINGFLKNESTLNQNDEFVQEENIIKSLIPKHVLLQQKLMFDFLDVFVSL